MVRKACLVTFVLSLVSSPLPADELDELKLQLADLKRRLEQLEQPQPQAAESAELPDNVVTSGDVHGSWKIPGTDSSMRLGGFIRAHMIYDIGPRPTSSGGDVASIHTAILEGTPEYQNRGDTRIAGRDARINVETYTPTAYGQMHTFIQADFKGDPDNKGSRATTSRSTFSMRHAYAEVGNFLAGITYSNYLDATVFGDKVDATGPTGRTMIRQGQIRYTHHLDDYREFAIAIENPHGDFVDADDENLDDGYPDFTMRFRHETDRWHYQFSGMLRRIGIDDGLGLDDTALSWALNHSGLFMFPGDRDRITWYLNFGDGIGRYLEGGKDQGASITPNGKLDTQSGYGGFVTYKHWWTPELSTNLDLGIGYYDLNPEEDAQANERLLSSHINLIWVPLEQLELGLEYVWGHRRVHDGREGEISRVQVNSIFIF